MGLFDDLRSRFLDSRGEGDFIPLVEDADAFGPGPLVLLYAVPASLGDDELRDMVADGMPARRDVTLRRVAATDDDGTGGDALLDATVGDALAAAARTGGGAAAAAAPTPGGGAGQGACPVLYFSGVSNAEMMATYRIVAREIYEETRGVHWPACAKVVAPAMEKTLRQVLGEISGDHAEAMQMQREAAAEAAESAWEA